MRRRSKVVVAFVVGAIVLSVFFLAPVISSPIKSSDCSLANPCPTRISAYESVGCALAGFGAGIDGRTLYAYYRFSNGSLGTVVAQKPWTYYPGCPPEHTPPLA